MASKPFPLTILVAEDEPHDVFFIKRAFADAGLTTLIQVVKDGQEAIDYISASPPFENRREHPLPDLLLLDLKMPRLNGFDVLTWLRKQPGLKRLPVVIFSSSTQYEDVNRAYDLGANSYLPKKAGSPELLKLVEQIDGYWCKLNQCPDCAP